MSLSKIGFKSRFTSGFNFQLFLRFVFLANTAPALQHQLLEQVEAPRFVAADTMNCWIESRLDDLKGLLKKIDALIINEDEARMLAAESNLIRSAEAILDMGPRVVIIKKGESGSIVCNRQAERFILPAYPAVEVKDPTDTLKFLQQV